MIIVSKFLRNGEIHPNGLAFKMLPIDVILLKFNEDGTKSVTSKTNYWSEEDFVLARVFQDFRHFC